jgi:hypothetical protein
MSLVRPLDEAILKSNPREKGVCIKTTSSRKQYRLMYQSFECNQIVPSARRNSALDPSHHRVLKKSLLGHLQCLLVLLLASSVFKPNFPADLHGRMPVIDKGHRCRNHLEYPWVSVKVTQKFPELLMLQYLTLSSSKPRLPCILGITALRGIGYSKSNPPFVRHFP